MRRVFHIAVISSFLLLSALFPAFASAIHDTGVNVAVAVFQAAFWFVLLLTKILFIVGAVWVFRLFLRIFSRSR